MKHVRIIGIDPGYGRCGFGVIERDGGDWRCVANGVMTTDGGEMPMRLLEIQRDLESILENYKPSLLVIEELFFAKSTTTALKVAQARGVIMTCAAAKGIEVREVKPNEVKLAVTGYGKADKGQVQEMVKQIFSLKQIPKPDDAADALAVAWSGTVRKI